MSSSFVMIITIMLGLDLAIVNLVGCRPPILTVVLLILILAQIGLELERAFFIRARPLLN